MSDVNSVSGAAPEDRRRWLILGVIAIAQLMVILDLTVMNIALPSAQHALHFTTADRQWVVTAYSLTFGSLLLLGGRLADLLGRKVTFLIGLAGFAGVSAIGGASVNFTMLVTARACQGVFAAILVPSALSLLTTTFTEPKDRGKAFGIYGAIAAGGSAVGLLLGGALTEYLSWRWTLYINLVFAGVAFVGGALLLQRHPSRVKPKLDIPGVVMVSSGLFCLVYGFSNAATHDWSTPSTYGFLVAGVALLIVFAFWQGRAPNPLLPPRVVLDRNRGGAYLSMLIAASGMFGTFLFLTYYLQQTLGYSPVVTGFAFLPIAGGIAVAANLSTIVLMPRVGPKPLVATGMLVAAGAAVWLAQLGPHTAYVTGVLGPLIMTGAGLGMVIAPSINTGTFGVAPQDAGVASATVTVGQQLGASIGTSLLNTIFASAVDGVRRRARRVGPAHRTPGADRVGPRARLRHRVLVDSRHPGLRLDRGRDPVPPRAAGQSIRAGRSTRRGRGNGGRGRSGHLGLNPLNPVTRGWTPPESGRAGPLFRAAQRPGRGHVGRREVLPEREGVRRRAELPQVQDPGLGLLRGRGVPARYPPQSGVGLGHLLEPAAAAPEHLPVRPGIHEPGQRLDRLPHRHVDQDSGAPGRVPLERADRRGVAVLGLQPPDEAGRRVRRRVHRVEVRHEVREQRAIQGGPQPRDVHLGEYVIHAVMLPAAAGHGNAAHPRLQAEEPIRPPGLTWPVVHS